MKKSRLILILPMMAMIGFFSPKNAFTQESAEEQETPTWRQTTCLLDGSTKCKKTGTGCSTYAGCPGLKEWIKIGPDVVKTVESIADAVD